MINKEKAIERYKSLLEAYEKSTATKEVDEKVENVRVEGVKKFRKSNEILESNETQEMKCELMKAKNKADELEKLNEQLREELQTLSRERLHRVAERGSQTDPINLGPPARENIEATTLSQDTEEEPFRIESETSHSEEKSAKWSTSRISNGKSPEAFLELERAKAETALLKTQNRHFTRLIKQLTFKNKVYQTPFSYE